MQAIQVSDISKCYGQVEAIKNITFNVGEGERFGFMGPDGAGKSTLFRILTTLLIPDSGSASVLGADVVKDYKTIRAQVGYMPGRFSLYQDLTVEENLTFFASVFGTTVQKNYELIKPIYSRLEPFKNRLAGKLSGGMKQKLALSCALIHKPKLLFLDEPTTGVDAVSRKEFWEMLSLLREEGITIIVSTPYMDEAKQCDRVALMQKGEILRIDTPRNVVNAFTKPLFGIKASNKYRLIQVLKSYEFADSVQPFGEFVHYTDQRPEVTREELQAFVISKGLEDILVNSIDPDIEDTFIFLMDEEKNHA